MITIDNTPIEEALARAAPLHDQAHDLQSVAKSIEGMALAAWYQCLLRQVIDANVSQQDVMPWRIKRTINCFVDTSARWIEPIELYRYVQAGWLDWLNQWIGATTRYKRDNINADAEIVFERWREKTKVGGDIGARIE